jgi:asparagine synthetase B (glutamine-hydrolysing)
VSSWHNPDKRNGSPSVFIYGSPYLAGDTSYGENTIVEKIDIDNGKAPDIVAQLYAKLGTRAFALLDGNFALLLSDPGSQSVFLVVDKFGCDDIYIHQDNASLRFASHPMRLLGRSYKFDPVSTAFFLAQEGFIPAPFTLSPDVSTIGRARFLRVRCKNGFRVEIERYWDPTRNRESSSTEKATERFYSLLKRAIDVRIGENASVLLSGGVDSSLISNIAARRNSSLVALTGAVKGHVAGEQEIAKARSLATALNVHHEAVLLDPQEESLPEEWTWCTNSWMSGARVTLPLWYRFAKHLRNRLGVGYTVLSGQMADTLADNNYTLPSAGYTFRRVLCSPWFFAAMPLLRRLSPKKDSPFGKLLIRSASTFRGTRIAGMLESLLDGMGNTQRFYEGRLFGYGEFPGRSSAYFPMLKKEGFERTTDWYSSNFVKPVVSRLQPATFYWDMFDLSLDMVMLHLDSRLVFHAFRLEGGKAQMPFLDTRVINFFCSLPYASRAFYREPKHIIRAQLRRKGMLLPSNSNGGYANSSITDPVQLILRGSLGAYFRELLRDTSLLNHVPNLFELVDESYVHGQLNSFCKGQPGTNYNFISKFAALELWNRTAASQNSEPGGRLNRVGPTI